MSPSSSRERVAEAYGEEVVSERHRHRYEFNPKYRTRFEESDLVLSGESPDGRLVEFIELNDHPFWIATQAHPEFKSRPDRPAPLFREFVRAALDERLATTRSSRRSRTTSRRLSRDGAGLGLALRFHVHR